MTKIFLIGATGYIGGSVLQKLLSIHPELESGITALVRSEQKGKTLRNAYPSLSVVLGDLDSSEVLAEEAAKSDIVITSADSDHPGHIKSIYEGFSRNPTKVSYLIHTSGTGVFIDLTTSKAGEESQTDISNKVWDDVADIDELNSLPETLLHRNVDNLIQAPPTDNIKYAIVCPPLIFGKGSGLFNKNTVAIPLYLKVVLERREAFIVGQGENPWCAIHIEDLVDLFISLVEEATKPNGGKATWNKEGFYFAEVGPVKFKEIAVPLAKVAYEEGLIDTEEVKSYDVDKVKAIHPFGPLVWGTKSLSKATRARSVFGWTPKHTAASIADRENFVFELEHAKAMPKKSGFLWDA
ncbi:hypothetical protein ABW19_dt0204893 [Dactylella cylindrospora]|nr:hypothetical protein ABW19_dt0204893 [Dactylella cylindrospora]